MEIDLSRQGLESLPEDFWISSGLSTDQVTQLNLLANLLTSLPNEITKLKNLEVLNLGWNQFTQIPEAVFKLPKLETLILGQNILEVIDQRVFEIPSLTILNLSGNKIASIPKVDNSCVPIRELYLDNNLISKISSGWFNQADSLEILC